MPKYFPHSLFKQLQELQISNWIKVHISVTETYFPPKLYIENIESSMAIFQIVLICVDFKATNINPFFKEHDWIDENICVSRL